MSFTTCILLKGYSVACRIRAGTPTSRRLREPRPRVGALVSAASSICSALLCAIGGPPDRWAKSGEVRRALSEALVAGTPDVLNENALHEHLAAEVDSATWKSLAARRNRSTLPRVVERARTELRQLLGEITLRPAEDGAYLIADLALGAESVIFG